MRNVQQPQTEEDKQWEEDTFFRPEHDPSSLVNRLAQGMPILSAPGLAVYSGPDGVILVFKKMAE